MDAFLKSIDRLCDGGAYAAAALLVALFALGLAEIILRGAFGISLPFAVEYTGYLLILSLFLGSGWTLRQDGHIRVGILNERLPARIARALDIACTIIGLGVALFMASALVRYGIGTLVRGTVSYYPSATPLAYPQLLTALGPCLLALALLARLIRLLRGETP